MTPRLADQRSQYNYTSAPQNTQVSKTRTTFTLKQGTKNRLKSLRDNGGKINNRIEAVKQSRQGDKRLSKS